jgi:hypothetical protein
MLVPRADEPSVVPRRPGNRLRYLAEAVAPLHDRLGAERLERLVTALALCVGMKSIMVTVDTCALPPATAEEITRWAAAALLHAALDEAASAETGLAVGRGGVGPCDRGASPPRQTGPENGSA